MACHPDGKVVAYNVDIKLVPTCLFVQISCLQKYRQGNVVNKASEVMSRFLGFVHCGVGEK